MEILGEKYHRWKLILITLLTDGHTWRNNIRDKLIEITQTETHKKTEWKIKRDRKSWIYKTILMV